ncbi:hypothetical protein [Aliihoeflea sp. 40Bstr573]|uniref:hypothetical protein n=1 Tax=Aliihoeflea sp. 40Bstr573 TaxID=2696467 RepID=UPI002094E5DD|nr:hypothetical protein [Aliihoeflea sp. 40Bstr573]
MYADRLASIARVEFDKLATVQNMSGVDSEAPFDLDRKTHDAYLARIGAPHFEPDLLFPGDNPVAQIAGALRMALRTLEAGAVENSPLGHCNGELLLVAENRADSPQGLQDEG